MIGKAFSIAKECALLSVIFIIVLIVNYPVLTFDMMYPEQPLLYIANQTVNSFSDLLHIYTHPQLLHYTIPFFRPSGHFLIYQLLTPILGWHNTKGFIVLNLIFLSLVGYLIIKIYQILFPQFKFGGFVSFSLHLMHPALSLSKLITLHFEFAYVFFLLLSLYCFMIFFHANQAIWQSIVPHKIKVEKIYLLIFSLIFYFLAATFKEPALMLGGVLLLYFLLALHHRKYSLRQLILHNKTIREIIALLMIFSTTLLIYITLAWPTLSHPDRSGVPFRQMFSAGNEFLKIIFSFPYDFFKTSTIELATMNWRHITYPQVTKYIIWFINALTLLSLSLLLLRKNCDEAKKSILFIFLASLFFLFLPIGWAMGLPWHLSLTLLFLGFAQGFSCEYLGHFVFKGKKYTNVLMIVLAFLISCTTISVNLANIKNYTANKPLFFALLLNHNAILHPPPIQKQLNKNSMIVVEDSKVHTDYFLGDGTYPFYLLKDFNFSAFEKKHQYHYLKIYPNYNGNLFRWAYLLPSLKEELYPFSIHKMDEVPNEVIYDWLKHYNNIFCLGYDEQANWQDRTTFFKDNLLKEKKKRKLSVNLYDAQLTTMLKGNLIYSKNLPFPDIHLCQYICDQDKNCTAFNFIHINMLSHRIIQCQFFSAYEAFKKENLVNAFLKKNSLF